MYFRLAQNWKNTYFLEFLTKRSIFLAYDTYWILDTVSKSKHRLLVLVWLIRMTQLLTDSDTAWQAVCRITLSHLFHSVQHSLISCVSEQPLYLPLSLCSATSAGSGGGQMKRMYSAVPGRVYVATRAHSSGGDRELSLNKGDRVKGETEPQFRSRVLWEWEKNLPLDVNLMIFFFDTTLVKHCQLQMILCNVEILYSAAVLEADAGKTFKLWSKTLPAIKCWHEGREDRKQEKWEVAADTSSYYKAIHVPGRSQWNVQCY